MEVNNLTVLKDFKQEPNGIDNLRKNSWWRHKSNLHGPSHSNSVMLSLSELLCILKLPNMLYTRIEGVVARELAAQLAVQRARREEGFCSVIQRGVYRLRERWENEHYLIFRKLINSKLLILY